MRSITFFAPAAAAAILAGGIAFAPHASATPDDEQTPQDLASSGHCWGPQAYLNCITVGTPRLSHRTVEGVILDNSGNSDSASYKCEFTKSHSEAKGKSRSLDVGVEAEMWKVVKLNAHVKWEKSKTITVSEARTMGGSQTVGPHRVKTCNLNFYFWNTPVTYTHYNNYVPTTTKLSVYLPNKFGVALVDGAHLAGEDIVAEPTCPEQNEFGGCQF